MRGRPFVVGFIEGLGYNGRAPFAVAFVRALRWGLTYRVHPGVRRRRLLHDLHEMAR